MVKIIDSKLTKNLPEEILGPVVKRHNLERTGFSSLSPTTRAALARDTAQALVHETHPAAFCASLVSWFPSFAIFIPDTTGHSRGFPIGEGGQPSELQAWLAARTFIKENPVVS